MSELSSPRFLVLHALRLKGVAEPASIAASTGIDVAGVEVELKALDAGGLAGYREGRISGWSLRSGGRDEHLGALAIDNEARPAAHGELTAAYRDFLELNGEMLEVCTAWQLRPEGSPGDTVINDHTDAGYDDLVVTRLVDVHERAVPVLARLGATMPRFSLYERRLEDALLRVREGEVDWFTKPLIDSYHTVWFELHEDLLATLGLVRGSEAEVLT